MDRQNSFIEIAVGLLITRIVFGALYGIIKSINVVLPIPEKLMNAINLSLHLMLVADPTSLILALIITSLLLSSIIFLLSGRPRE